MIKPQRAQSRCASRALVKGQQTWCGRRLRPRSAAASTSIPVGDGVAAYKHLCAPCVLCGRISRCVLLLAILLLVVSTAHAASVAVPIDGEPFPAELTAVNASWQLTFDTDDTPRTLPAGELVHWGAPPEPRGGPVVVLVDGGAIPARPSCFDRATLTCESDTLGDLRLPLELVAGLVFHLPGDRQLRDVLLDRVVRADGDSDRVLLTNGDEVAGAVAGLGDAGVELATAAGRSAIGIDRAAAIVFNPALRRRVEPRGLRAWVGLNDGSLLLASSLVSPPDTKSAEITLALGQRWTADMASVVFLQPLGGRAVYLSDLRPAEYRHVAFLDLPWDYQSDRSVSGGRLRSDGRIYLKGLGLHSAARITYLLVEPYERFQADLGIDDATDGGGSTRFRVFVDAQQQFTSDILRGGTSSVPVDIDLAGAKRLDLVVDYTDRADQLDHADWLDARLIRAATTDGQPSDQPTSESKP